MALLVGFVWLDTDPLAAYPLPVDARDRWPGAASSADRHRPRVAAESENPIEDWLQGERLTGEWFGARTWLRDHGVEVEGFYIGDTSYPLRGGVREVTAYRHLADLRGIFDMEKLAGIPGGRLFVEAYSIWGDFGAGDVGDFQVYDNIDNPKDRLQVAELWWQQQFASERIRIKLGKFDANSEFALPDAGGDFIGSSAGFSPTIFTMATYPDPSTGALAFAYPKGPFYAGVGLFDGSAVHGAKVGKRGPKTFFTNASDYFVIGEIGLRWDETARFGPSRIALGPWYHSADFQRWNGTQAGETGGFWALFEQRVLRIGPQRDEGTREVRVFGQYGWADSSISPANHHASLGVLWVGPLASRATDTTGVLVNWVDLADQDAAGFAGNEVSLELFYSLQLTPFFSLKPDLQLIDTPSGAHVPSVWVGTLRFEIGL